MSPRPAKSPAHARRNAREAAKRARDRRVDEARTAMARGEGFITALPAQTRSAMMWHAVESLRGGPRAGARSNAYRLDDALLFGLAHRVIVEAGTVEQAVRDFAPDLRRAKVSDRCAETWLGEVRRKYVALHLDRTKRYIEDQDVLRQSGDPKSVIDRLMTRTAIIADDLLGEIRDASVGERHTILRTLEVVAGLADTLGGYSHKEVTTEKMRLALERALAEARRSSPAGQVHDLDAVAAIIRREAGLDPPRGREAA